MRKGRISAYSPGSKRSGEDVAWVAKIIARPRQKVRRELGHRARQFELAVIENESGTIQIEDFERLGNPAIDSDVIADDLMDKLIEHLKEEELLEATP